MVCASALAFLTSGALATHGPDVEVTLALSLDESVDPPGCFLRDG
jgi:hypothetical protein